MTLRLVSFPPRPQPEPAVFTADACARLAALNDVARRLRDWGIPVRFERWDCSPPQITIDRAGVRIGALLDAAGPRRYLSLGDRRVQVSCDLDGVEIVWSEP